MLERGGGPCLSRRPVLEPLAEVASAPGPSARLVEPLPLLIVDDEVTLHHSYLRLLTQRGLAGECVGSGAEALALLEVRSFGVVLSDFRMPGLDGIALLACVRERWPETQRILITGRADGDAPERAINEAGVVRFVSKPFDPAGLLATLEEALAANTALRERAVLLERLENRNHELAYLNRELAERVVEDGAVALRFRRRWDVALHAISDPLLVIGPGLRIEGANRAAATMAAARGVGGVGGAGGVGGVPVEGVPVEGAPVALEGRLCHEVLFGASAPCAGCPLPGGGSGRIAYPSACGGEARTLDARAYEIPGPSPAYLIVYHDVTRALAEDRAAAETAKVAVVGRLAQVVAHEINNPLHAIMSFTHLARRPDVDAARLTRYLDAIRDCAIRCRDIVQSIRELSRGAPERTPATTDVRHACELALEPLHATLDPRLELALGAHGARCRGGEAEIVAAVTRALGEITRSAPPDAPLRLVIVDAGDELAVVVEERGAGARVELRFARADLAEELHG